MSDYGWNIMHGLIEVKPKHLLVYHVMALLCNSHYLALYVLVRFFQCLIGTWHNLRLYLAKQLQVGLLLHNNHR